MREDHSSVASASPTTPGVAAMPHRVQLSRAKGWRMPADTKKVDRSTPHGNPWRIKRVDLGPMVSMWWVNGPRADEEYSSEAEATAVSLRKFRYYAETNPRVIAGLRGKNLACWCGIGSPCHADVLLELANAEPIAGPPARVGEGEEASADNPTKPNIGGDPLDYQPV